MCMAESKQPHRPPHAVPRTPSTSSGCPPPGPFWFAAVSSSTNVNILTLVCHLCAISPTRLCSSPQSTLGPNTPKRRSSRDPPGPKSSTPSLPFLYAFLQHTVTPALLVSVHFIGRKIRVGNVVSFSNVKAPPARGVNTTESFVSTEIMIAEHASHNGDPIRATQLRGVPFHVSPAVSTPFCAACLVGHVGSDPADGPLRTSTSHITRSNQHFERYSRKSPCSPPASAKRHLRLGHPIIAYYRTTQQHGLVQRR